MLTAVIPVYNEAESLAELHQELAAVAREQAYDLEVIFVDDGSTDRSWAEIQRLAVADPRVRGLRFRRNFGKAAALNAGFEAARGEYVFTLDADLQDDPHEIPRFLEQVQGGLDVVSGWKQVRHDPWHKVGPSRVFQLAGGQADRRSLARPQLRLQVLPPRGRPRSPNCTVSCIVSCRSWPAARGLDGGRGRRPPSAPQVRRVEVRPAAFHQGPARFVDRVLPDRLRSTAPASAGHHRPAQFPVGWFGSPGADGGVVRDSLELLGRPPPCICMSAPSFITRWPPCCSAPSSCRSVSWVNC